MTAALLQPVEVDDLPDYPLAVGDDLHGHYFIAWFHREWLNSEMRLKGTEEARALYFDLICISQDQKPVGTLPDDIEQLAKLLMVDLARLRRMCDGAFGPLHRWQRCRCGDEVRLFHPRVLKMVLDAVSRREDNRAKNEAANAAKRLRRLRERVAGFHPELAKNDAAILWMDDWLTDQGCAYRSAEWHERAIAAWSNHAFSLHRRRGPAET
ncbi:hypothetical protein SAMN05444722_1701 [Rhodovulum sp. ES.010]|uniref:hypothetical protein n=1 Tax=Rhodovulum sp. ES.010 TaxID=1882821 RepID=UPI00092A39A7|nr:hypothetical protein [Rhodovulum sp. ES.010]SIO36708.1 hypothetical protein SAMN05444722_1701 [Rhodovulum sp. ES.010]